MNAKICKSISAIIPVANRPDLLSEALDSIAKGVLVPAEIIVVLNHPQPEIRQKDHLSALDWQSSRAPALALKIVTALPSGPAVARNKGIQTASGSWLAFLDSDDLWHSTKLSEQWNYLQKRPHLLACHCKEEWRKFDQQIAQPLELQPCGGQFLKSALHHCLISASGLLIHKQVFKRCGMFDESYPICEDYELWLRILEQFPIGLLQKALVTKRSGQWPQLSRDSHSLDFFRIKALLQLAARQLPHPELSQRALVEAEYKYTILSRGQIKYQKQISSSLQELALEIQNIRSEMYRLQNAPSTTRIIPDQP